MIVVAAGLILVLPLFGVWLAGQPVARYIEFPPRTVYVEHPGFSAGAAAGIGLLVLGVVALWLFFPRRSGAGAAAGSAAAWPAAAWPAAAGAGRRFPAWGHAGVVAAGVSWVLAWTRFAWFAPMQPHAFTPLWVSYIVVVNALTYRRVGRCMLTDDARYLAALVPVSAVVWWSFEYLNRFVQNWYYLGVQLFGPLEYFVDASLPFATVLPAVLGTAEYISTFRESMERFRDRRPIALPSPRGLAVAVLAISILGLALVGVLPQYLFPLLWVSPLLIGVSLRTLQGRPHLFSEVAAGDWRRFTAAALAALVCGFFWEMWNWRCLAKWVYAVPFVDRWHLFEMPLLGYAGYLPFGLACLFVGDLVREALAAYGVVSSPSASR